MSLLDSIRHQELVVAALREAHRRGRIAHAYLFWGPEGVGKLRTGLALAQLLLCRGNGGSAPCGQCSGCERVGRLTHPDLHVVLPARRGSEGELQRTLEEYGRDPYHCLQIPPNASIGIERVRSLKSESSKARVETGNRVIVIREAERMTPEAAQAALKLIEEPQAGTYIILTCRDPSHLLPTILSRCQRLRFRPLPRAFIEEVLGERLGRPADQTRMIAGLAGGSVGRAVAMSEEDIVALRKEALELFERPAIDPAEIGQRVASLGRAWDAGAARTMVGLLMTWHEDLLAVRLSVAGEAVTNSDQLAALRRRAARLSVVEIKRRVEILEELLGAIERYVNPALALQTALLRLNGLVAEDAFGEAPAPEH